MLRWLAAVSLVFPAAVSPAQQPGRLGSTPQPTAKDLELERQFVAGIVDPQNTLDLIAGRPRVILLKACPTRTLVADPSLVGIKLLEPAGTQLLVLGSKPGITVLNLWFTESAAQAKDRILSFHVRILPDPEAKDRRAAQLKVLENEINAVFPNSTIRIIPVADKVLLRGQTQDVRDAQRIPHLIK
jgi:pilus assembly protein CpaC